MAPNISIDRLAYEMLEFEVHFVRNALTAALIRAQMYQKTHPHDPRAHEIVDVLDELRHRIEDALMKALRDPDTRRAQ